MKAQSRSRRTSDSNKRSSSHLVSVGCGKLAVVVVLLLVVVLLAVFLLGTTTSIGFAAEAAFLQTGGGPPIARTRSFPGTTTGTSRRSSSSSILRIVTRIQEKNRREINKRCTHQHWTTKSTKRPFIAPPIVVLFSKKGQSSSSSSSFNGAASMDSVTVIKTGADFTASDDSNVSDCNDNPVASSSSSSSPSVSSLLQEWKHHDSVEFHYFSPTEAAAIRAALLSWYHANRRKLPWRGDAPPWDGSSTSVAATAAAVAAAAAASSNKRKNASSSCSSKSSRSRKKSNNETIEPDKVDNRTLDSISSAITTSNTTRDGAFAITAYGVWVSEIMLQQTRVEAVIDYWVRWMQTFPTVDALAAATEEQVNAHWAGLGFYRRARMLHQAAKIVVAQYDKSELPRTVSELIQLPGIGRYTACAIASIAYNVAVPVVDGNVCRVLARLRGIANHIKEPAFKDKWAWTLAEQIVNATSKNSACGSSDVASYASSNDVKYDLQAGNVNQAIMELGATYCSPSGTGTDPNDPLKEFYWSTRIATQAAASMKSSATTPAAATITTATANAGCQVCCKGGINQALETLQTLILEAPEDGQRSGMVDETAVAAIGHKAFPLAPPKPVRRDDVLAVAAISMTKTTVSTNSSDDHERWLLVKRPPTGLLAGQWEFPSACIWTSSEDNGRNKKKQQQDPPQFAVTLRRRALKTLLREIMTGRPVGGGSHALVSTDHLTTKLRGDSNIHQTPSASTSSRGGQKRNPDTDPLVHVFSHVRHTMWIEQVQVSIDDTTGSDDSDDDDDDDDYNDKQIAMEWIDLTGRHARWMNQKDMQEVGVTSGVKKILAAVAKARSKLSLSDQSSMVNKKQPAKKRQRKR
jgi:A/G-specific adenine glycosylase